MVQHINVYMGECRKGGLSRSASQALCYKQAILLHTLVANCGFSYNTCLGRAAPARVLDVFYYDALVLLLHSASPGGGLQKPPSDIYPM